MDQRIFYAMVIFHIVLYHSYVFLSHIPYCWLIHKILPMIHVFYTFLQYIYHEKLSPILKPLRWKHINHPLLQHICVEQYRHYLYIIEILNHLLIKNLVLQLSCRENYAYSQKLHYKYYYNLFHLLLCN